MTDEEYVRSVWKLVGCCDGSYRNYPRDTVIVQDVNGHWFDFPDWSAAAEFTRERLEKVRQLRDQVTLQRNLLVNHWLGVSYCIWRPIGERTLSFLEAELARLTQDMKEPQA